MTTFYVAADGVGKPTNNGTSKEEPWDLMSVFNGRNTGTVNTEAKQEMVDLVCLPGIYKGLPKDNRIKLLGGGHGKRIRLYGSSLMPGERSVWDLWSGRLQTWSVYWCTCPLASDTSCVPALAGARSSSREPCGKSRPSWTFPASA